MSLSAAPSRRKKFFLARDKRMILSFLVGSVAFHLLYYTLKNIIVPAFSGDNTKAVVAEIAKRLVIYAIKL